MIQLSTSLRRHLKLCSWTYTIGNKKSRREGSASVSFGTKNWMVSQAASNNHDDRVDGSFDNEISYTESLNFRVPPKASL